MDETNFNMLSYEDWADTVCEMQDKIEEIERKLAYRRLKVLTEKRIEPNSTLRIRDYENEILATDPVYAQLDRQIKRAKDDLLYIKGTGYMPIDDEIHL